MGLLRGPRERAKALYRALGKHLIRLRREVRGHVANRLQAALWHEAFHLVREGIASVAEVDAAIAPGPGLRWRGSAWPYCTGPRMRPAPEPAWPTRCRRGLAAIMDRGRVPGERRHLDRHEREERQAG